MVVEPPSKGKGDVNRHGVIFVKEGGRGLRARAMVQWERGGRRDLKDHDGFLVSTEKWHRFSFCEQGKLGFKIRRAIVWTRCREGCAS